MLNDLLEGPYALLIKIGAAVGVAAILFGSGYLVGHHHAIVVEKVKVVDHILVQTKYLPVEEKKLSDAHDKIKVVHDKTVIYVTKTVPDNRACDVPADAVGVLNANRALPPGP